MSDGPEVIAALRALVGPDGLLFGSDRPYVPGEAVGEEMEVALGQVPEGDRDALMSGDATRLFPKLAARLIG